MSLRFPVPRAVWGAVCTLAALGAVPAAAATDFHMPSSNIRCTMSGAGAKASVQCWVLSTSCRGIQGGRYAYSWGMRAGQRPTRFCPGDISAAGRMLAYGRHISRGVMTCRSQTAGLTCTNRRTQRGFFLSRQRQRIF